jgi:PAS domain S-box-containing protein
MEPDRFHAFVEGAVDAVFQGDAAGRFMAVNEQGCILAGYSREELLAMSMADLFSPGELSRAALRYDVLSEGKTITAERLLTRKDGTVVPVEMKSKRMPDGTYQSIMRNLAERQEAETVLKTSEAKYRRLHESMTDAFVGVDLAGRILECNVAYQTMLGYTEDELRRLTYMDLTPEKWHAFEAQIVAGQILSRGYSDVYEKEYRRRDGTVFPVELRSVLVRDAAGKPEVMWAMVRDITERKRLQAAAEKRLLALTCPQAGDAAVLFDDLFNLADIQRIQDEFAAATGVASIITRPDGTPITKPSRFTRLCSEIVRRTAKGCANCYKSDAILGAPHPGGPIVQPCLSGGLWDAGASITVGGRHVANWLIGQVRDATQTEEGMRAYAREIGADEAAFLEAFREVPAMSSERFRSVAQALFTLANQLSTAAYQNVQQARFINERQQAEETRFALERKLLQAQKAESLGRMAGAIAHNFNNTLCALRGNLELAMNGLPPGTDVAKNLAAAMQAGRKASELSGLMLTYLGQTVGNHELLDLAEACRQTLPALRAAMPNGVDLQAELPSPGPIIWATAHQVQEVLTHLATNAWEAFDGEQGGIRLAVKTVAPAEIPVHRRFPLDWQPQDTLHACLEVTDSGCGIAATDIDAIFDPFFTTKFTGRGLGLSIVLGLVRAHGGGVTVESAAGRGSLFSVFWPVLAETDSRSPAGREMPAGPK